jgi:hypothetical protein
MIGNIKHNICFSIFWIYCLNDKLKLKKGIKKKKNEKLPHPGDWIGIQVTGLGTRRLDVPT